MTRAKEIARGIPVLGAIVIEIRRRPVRGLGFLIIGSLVIAALFAPWIAPADPLEADARRILEPPNQDAIFGRDSAGLDVFSRVIYGARVDLTIAFAVTVLAAGIGIPAGVFSGYKRGVFGEAISRSFDVMQALPVFVFAMAIVAARGPGIVNVIIVLSVLNSPIFARLMRSQTYSLRDKGFVEAARVSGESDKGIVLRHLLPNAIGPGLAQMSVTAGFAILLTSGLSFVGAGVQPPTPEWGAMVASSASSLVTGEWWASLFPSFAIGLAVFGFALVGETIEAALAPTRKAR